jgi:hypothetical protein
MIVEITVRSKDGTVISQHIQDALQPCEWKTHPDHPEREGDYQYFGFTYQPRVRLNSKAGGF